MAHDDPIDAMIAKMPPPVAKTVAALRALVKEKVPGVAEKAQAAWKTINFDRNGGLIAIGGHASWATIGFMRGAELHDPECRLQGTGKTMRNVRVDPAAPIPRAYLSKLIAEAVALNDEHGPPAGVGRAWGGAKSTTMKPGAKVKPKKAEATAKESAKAKSLTRARAPR